MNLSLSSSRSILAAFASLALASSLTAAGPYAPKAGVSGTTAIHMSSTDFVAWATGVDEYIAGTNVAASWQDTSKALGPATGTSTDITCLGNQGSITLTFDNAICNGAGWDFAIFENSFSDTFLELGFVEVSTDGTHYVRFATSSLTASAVGGFGSVDPTNIDGFAGKYRAGYGTPFDLSDLAGQDNYEYLDLNCINYVRIVDVLGDGSELDDDGNPIYDPYPTSGSAGFDLNGVGVIHAVPEPAACAAVAGLAVLGLALRRRHSALA
jgi:hypothetical protein